MQSLRRRNLAFPSRRLAAIPDEDAMKSVVQKKPRSREGGDVAAVGPGYTQGSWKVCEASLSAVLIKPRKIQQEE